MGFWSVELLAWLLCVAIHRAGRQSIGSIVKKVKPENCEVTTTKTTHHNHTPAASQGTRGPTFWPRPVPSYPRNAHTPAQPRPGLRPRSADSLRLIGKCSFLRTRPSRSHHLPPSRENSKALARHPPAHYSGCSRGGHHRAPSLTRRPKTASAVVPGPHNIYSLSIHYWRRRGMTSSPRLSRPQP